MSPKLILFAGPAGKARCTAARKHFLFQWVPAAVHVRVKGAPLRLHQSEYF